MNHHLSIDYDEGKRDSYRGVVLKDPSGKETRWATGDPQADWAAYLQHAIENEILVIQSSSVYDFVVDVPGWRMILNDEDDEIIVPEDRPQFNIPKDLEPGMMFYDIGGDVVKLYGPVPGDGTQWTVERWENGHWSYTGSRIEPSDLHCIAEDPETPGPQI